MARDNQVLNGGQVIVDYLIREKVPYAFGLCGHGNIGFIDALYDGGDQAGLVPAATPRTGVLVRSRQF
jgi:thiamine pyrophosphate-dependent acetolactate synthase large subunit-like protein